MNKNRAPSCNSPAWQDVAAIRHNEATPDGIREAWKAVNSTELERINPAAFCTLEKRISGYYNPPGWREKKRMFIDILLGTHGVEYLGRLKRTQDTVYYCNAGDPYATTIIFIGGNLSVGSWGGLVENNLLVETE